uniref:Uncharacterized protein n=1 Tax=Moniliophthora roreri TaxID=221103 RepID=A0A0W0FAJ7_MONRR
MGMVETTGFENKAEAASVDWIEKWLDTWEASCSKEVQKWLQTS